MALRVMYDVPASDVQVGDCVLYEQDQAIYPVREIATPDDTGLHYTFTLMNGSYAYAAEVRAEDTFQVVRVS